jgi:predicted Zn finger-like uncharacterized protein
MLSPVFHPNIAPHAICVGDHWGAGESLESIIIRIGEMLAYQSYNVKSPLNGEAARWVEENKHRVPLDRVSMLPEEENGNASKLAAAISPPSTGAPVAVNSVMQSSVVQPQPPPAPALTPPRAPTPTPPPTPAPTPGNPSLIQVDCPLCATSYRVPPGVVGKNVKCKKCGHLFVCIATQTG